MKVTKRDLMQDLKGALAKKREGQDRSQAKGAKRKAVITKGLGLAIVHALEAQGETVRGCILKVIGCNSDTIMQSINEVSQERDRKVKECTGERKEKKQKSVYSSFSRILTILRAVWKGENVDKIKGAHSLQEMYAFASRKGTARGSSKKPMNAEQAADYNSKVARFVPQAPGRNPRAGERERYDDGIARLEAHIMSCLTELQKHEGATYLPVKAWLTQARGTKKHLRVVKVRKAA
jgi:hypothetical protein